MQLAEVARNTKNHDDDLAAISASCKRMREDVLKKTNKQVKEKNLKCLVFMHCLLNVDHLTTRAMLPTFSKLRPNICFAALAIWSILLESEGYTIQY